MPEKIHARMKCPYCQADVDATLNTWYHCAKCHHDLLVATPEKQAGSPCFYVLVFGIGLFTLVYLFLILS